MKSLTLLTILVLSTTLPAFAVSDKEALEKMINVNSLVSANCTIELASRFCVVSPREHTSFQEYQDELSFVKTHLKDLGVETRKVPWNTLTKIK